MTTSRSWTLALADIQALVRVALESTAPLILSAT